MRRLCDVVRHLLLVVAVGYLPLSPNESQTGSGDRDGYHGYCGCNIDRTSTAAIVVGHCTGIGYSAGGGGGNSCAK